ncbi:MAG: outer membrane protein assembly factor BamB [Verrucomicrobiales bacterium]|jgi:outer membrane protein assembly factor BamB
MKTTLTLITPLITALQILSASADPWPSWRGDAEGSGRTGETELPTSWAPDKNVRWRVDLPERGNSTPVISRGNIFVTQAIDAEKFRGLMCFDRTNGKLLWKRGVSYAKAERTHRDNPYCSASPATDGVHVFVSYGSAGVACYDFAGKEIWTRDLGVVDHEWGNSTSPVLCGDLCIQYHGPGKGAVLAALDKKSGKIVWKLEEPAWQPGERTDGFRGRSGRGVIGSFSTPIIVEADGRKQLVMSFPMELRSYDPATGKELWRCAGLNPLVYTSPVHDGGLIVAMGGYYGNSIGVKVDGSGDITKTGRLWQEVRHKGGIGSGVAKDGMLYFQDSGGVAYCIEMETGTTLWEERLPGKGKSWGSFVLAGDLIYTLSQPGDSVVFRADPDKFEVVAQSDLKEHTNSSIAVSEGELFIRTHEALWCIGDAAKD